MKKIIFISALLGLFPVAQAASPADVAAAARIVAQTSKMIEKYASKGIVIEAPEPRADSDGKYVVPYTADGAVTPWAEKALNAAVGSAAGKEAGNKAAGVLAKSRPSTLTGPKRPGNVFDCLLNISRITVEFIFEC